MLRALSLIDLSVREEVYHAARCLLITRKEDYPLFEDLFGWFWEGFFTNRGPTAQPAPLAPRHDPTQHQKISFVSLLNEKASLDDPEEDVTDRSFSFSVTEVMQQKRFSQMTPEELEQVKRVMQRFRWRVGMRRTRRLMDANQGQQFNLRRMQASALRTQGVPLELHWQKRKIKPRPIVLLADISGSMEKFSRLILQFFHGLTQDYQQTETFVFGTRLTRITEQLKLRNIDQALTESGREVIDWSGGTKIGACLAQFNKEWSRRVLRRGALVLIVSDGCDTGDLDELKDAMRFLQHRCARLIWLNPYLGNAAYRPEVRGMATALPFLDDFMSIRNLQSLQELAGHLERL